MAYYDLKTKSCPFCAETIQSQAIKCRFCGEFLNTAKAKAMQADLDDESLELSADDLDEGVLYACSPSLWGMISAFIKGFLFMILAGVIITLPVENMLNHRLGIELSSTHLSLIGQYRVLAGAGLIVLILLVIIIKSVDLKMIYYEICADRIEWSRGLLDRKVDNIDMFRIMDMKLRRNLLDCILGIGTVVLTTNDKSDPEFVFKKVYNSRELYDIIKKASLEADRRSGVVHLD
jgi:hypothetical protein